MCKVVWGGCIVCCYLYQYGCLRTGFGNHFRRIFKLSGYIIFKITSCVWWKADLSGCRYLNCCIQQHNLLRLEFLAVIYWQCTYNVTWRRFRAIILQWKGNTYCIFWVCVCSLRYRACNAHAPYCHLWPFLLYNIFLHYLINGQFFERKIVIEHKKLFFSVINQLDAQNFCFTIILFHASTCFEHMCSPWRGQNCFTQPLVSSHL